MVVEPTKLYSQQVPASFKLTMASLGSNKELEDCSSSTTVKSQRTSLIFNLDNKDDFTLCSLTPEKVEQQPLDLVLTEGETISFRVEGSHSIHLSGNYIRNEETDEYDDEEEMYSDEAEEDSQIEYDSEDLDSEDFDDSDSGSEIEKLNLKKEKKNPRIRVIESDEDEEDDSEFDSEMSEEDLDSEDLESEDLESEDLESKSEEESQKPAKRSIKFDLPETKKSKDTVTPVASPVAAKVSPVAAKISPVASKISPVASKVNPVTVTAKVTPPPATEKVAATVVAKTANPTPEVIKVAAPVKKILPSGLEIEDLKLGSGSKANQGKAVLIRYKGTLLNGKVFDSNFGVKPLKFVVGKGDVIKGMDIGIVGMAVGGTRKLVIPGPLAYGKQALPGIPRDSTLIFEIRLEKIL